MKGKISLVLPPAPTAIFPNGNDQHPGITSTYRYCVQAPVDQNNVLKKEGNNGCHPNNIGQDNLDRYNFKESIVPKNENDNSPATSLVSDISLRYETESVSNELNLDEDKNILDKYDGNNNKFKEIDDLISYLTNQIKSQD